MTKANDLRNQRNGNIDMLRILATFFIVISHFVPKYLWNGNEELCGVMFQNLASMKLNDQIMMLYNTLGHIGNNLFVVCSACPFLKAMSCGIYFPPFTILIGSTGGSIIPIYGCMC